MMKIAMIKKLNEKIPYWMKRPFSSLIRGKLINNEVFQKQYELLRQADFMTESDLERLQLEELKRVLVHAYYHTDYYRNLMDDVGVKPESITSLDKLKDFPILTKEQLKMNFEALQADDIHDFYDVRTGGTTGEPTHVLMERDSIYREWAFTYHYWEKYGYDFKSSKLATFRGVDLHGKLYEINPLYREIRLNVFKLNCDNVKKYLRQIDRYGADFLYGYPSAVYNLCRLAKEVGIKLQNRFQAVFLISENLYDFQEKEIKEVLDCPIAMFYGHTERAVYAGKADGGYNFQPLYGVTEINENGTLVVTGFINGKMPLIRYEVDDYVEVVDEKKLQIVGHRDSEVVYGKNGEQFRASALNFHGIISSFVPWFQFIQEVPGELTLRLPKGYVTQEDLDQLCSDIDRRLGGAIKIVLDLVEVSAGIQGGHKYRLLIQKIQNT